MRIDGFVIYHFLAFLSVSDDCQGINRFSAQCRDQKKDLATLAEYGTEPGQCLACAACVWTLSGQLSKSDPESLSGLTRFVPLAH
jgi:hypothetical protein